MFIRNNVGSKFKLKYIKIEFRVKDIAWDKYDYFILLKGIYKRNMEKL